MSAPRAFIVFSPFHSASAIFEFHSKAGRHDEEKVRVLSPSDVGFPSTIPIDLTSVHSTLAHGDLLPIQQLARMDEDMLRSTTNALPTRLAAKLWRARTDESVGDDPWQTGCKNVREFVKASDMRH